MSYRPVNFQEPIKNLEYKKYAGFLLGIGKEVKSY